MIVERLKQYPVVLWALALYLCSLGFNLKYDIPLSVLAISTIYAFGSGDNTTRIKQTLFDHWHVIVFLLLTLVVTFFSRDIKQSIHVQLQLLPALLIYVIIVNFVTDQRRFNFVFVAIIFGALITELTFLGQAIYFYQTPDPLEKIWAIKSPLLVAPNDVLFFSVLVPVAVSLGLATGDELKVKILGYLYLAITLVLVIYMRSRQAVGIYFVGLCLIALFYRPVAGIVVAAISVLVIIVVDWATGRALSSKLVYLFPRRYVWEAAWQMFIDRPWQGQGPGMFKLMYHEFLERAGYTLAQVEDRRPMNWAHSLYLEQLAERGVLGFLALILLVGRPVVLMIMSPIPLNFNKKILLSMFLAFSMAGLAETSLLRLWVVVFIFLLIGLMVSKGSRA